MREAIAQIKLWREEFTSLPLSQRLLKLSPCQVLQFKLAADVEEKLRIWAETYNLLDVAYLILKSASFRQESRGGRLSSARS